MKTIKKIPALLIGALSTVLLLSSCSNEDEGTVSLSGEMIELRVSTPQITENDESTEITKSGVEVPQPQTVTVPAGNGMTLEATLEPAPVTRGTTALATGIIYRVIAYSFEQRFMCYADYEVGNPKPIAGNLEVPAGGTYNFVCYSLNNSQTLPAITTNIDSLGYQEIIVDATEDLLMAHIYNVNVDSSSALTLTFNLTHMCKLVTIIADATDIGEDICDISATLLYEKVKFKCISLPKFGETTTAEHSIPFGIITPDQTVTSNPFVIYKDYNEYPKDYTFPVINIQSVTIGSTTIKNLKVDISDSYHLLFGQQLSGYKYVYTLKFLKAPDNYDSDGFSVGGRIWAKGNLIFNNSRSYHFASTQEYYSGQWDGGDYWNWCVLSPYSDRYIYPGNYSTQFDPCTKVEPAGTWRMPTRVELLALINSGTVVSAIKRRIQGHYFGINRLATGIEDCYLFLPCAGFRNPSSHKVSSPEDVGYYACTAACPGPNYERIALVFGNSTNGSLYDAFEANYFPRAVGISIRCVKN